MKKFKKGMRVRIYLRGCGATTNEDTGVIQKVSKGLVYTNESETPYDEDSGMWKDNGVVFGFTRWIQEDKS